MTNRRRPLKPLDDGIPDVVQRSSFPQYAYGALCAIRLAHSLGHDSVDFIELGVAGGNGLLELERIAGELELSYAPSINVTGFDLGSGMPRPLDYRDTPYIWQQGFFQMDETSLRKRLTRAGLVIGDVRETLPVFLEAEATRLGFIAFDLDYYSSTNLALTALGGASHRSLLPRTFCYFDDTVGPHDEYHSEYTGELLSISEYNGSEEASRKIAKIHGLQHKLGGSVAYWTDSIYVHHDFLHPDYNTYVFPVNDRQFNLGE